MIVTILIIAVVVFSLFVAVYAFFRVRDGRRRSLARDVESHGAERAAALLADAGSEPSARPPVLPSLNSQSIDGPATPRSAAKQAADDIQMTAAAPAKKATEMTNPPRPQEDWFSNLFGFAETSYMEAKRWLRIIPGGTSGVSMIESAVTGARFSAGRFGLPSLRELRHATWASPLPGRLVVTTEHGDASEKHTEAENKLAVFQVASQFNCLHFAGPTVVPEDGVASYANVRSQQGPACAIACGPGTVFRNYFATVSAPQKRSDDVPLEGQTRDRMIDNLADVSQMLGNSGSCELFLMQGGYMMASKEQLQKLNAKLLELEKQGCLDEVRAALRVGVHEDIQVTSSGAGSVRLSDESQLVTQVLCAACAVAYNSSSPPEAWKKFASLVLEASYEATLCAGVANAQRHAGKHGSRRVFLTDLGGGIFGNDPEWIAASISHACERFKDYDLDVRIVSQNGAVHSSLRQLEQDFSAASRASSGKRKTIQHQLTQGALSLDDLELPHKDSLSDSYEVLGSITEESSSARRKTIQHQMTQGAGSLDAMSRVHSNSFTHQYDALESVTEEAAPSRRRKTIQHQMTTGAETLDVLDGHHKGSFVDSMAAEESRERGDTEEHQLSPRDRGRPHLSSVAEAYDALDDPVEAVRRKTIQQGMTEGAESDALDNLTNAVKRRTIVSQMTQGAESLDAMDRVRSNSVTHQYDALDNPAEAPPPRVFHMMTTGADDPRRSSLADEYERFSVIAEGEDSARERGTTEEHELTPRSRSLSAVDRPHRGSFADSYDALDNPAEAPPPVVSHMMTTGADDPHRSSLAEEYERFSMIAEGEDSARERGSTEEHPLTPRSRSLSNLNRSERGSFVDAYEALDDTREAEGESSTRKRLR